MGSGKVIVVGTLTLLTGMLLADCGPRYRLVPPPDRSDADISWDLAYCQDKNRSRLVMQVEQVDPEECLTGRGWKREAIP
jgi:hypothetical protein